MTSEVVSEHWQIPTLDFNSQSLPLDVKFGRGQRVRVTAVQNEPTPAVPSGGYSHRTEKARRFGDQVEQILLRDHTGVHRREPKRHQAIE